MVITKIQSSNGKDIWEVDTINFTCTCPDYRYRRSKSGTFCKHIQKVIECITKEKIDYVKIIEANGDPISFIEKYGESTLDRLKLEGQVYEAKGKLRVMK